MTNRSFALGTVDKCGRVMALAFPIIVGMAGLWGEFHRRELRGYGRVKSQ